MIVLGEVRTRNTFSDGPFRSKQLLLLAKESVAYFVLVSRCCDAEGLIGCSSNRISFYFFIMSSSYRIPNYKEE